MSELREVPPKTPVLDYAQTRGGRIGLVAFILRPFKALRERIHRARVQKEITERWHSDEAIRAHLAEHDRQWEQYQLRQGKKEE